MLIADISGKGVDAAVLTAFIKFMMRAIALRVGKPGAILAEFNVVLRQGGRRSVPLRLDVRRHTRHRYVPVDLRQRRSRRRVRAHGAIVTQLAVTGPVLGVMEEPFGTETIGLARGDTLVLATDGLTEVRNPSGQQLTEEGAMELLKKTSLQSQLLADEMAAKVREYGGNRIRDDLAILVIRVLGLEAPRE